MLTSGTPIRLEEHIKTANGSLIPAGTRAMILGVARSASPAIFCCETFEDDVYVVEEFYCCDNHFVVIEEAV